jgi:iron complex outermembrane recepter protein
MNYYVRSLLLSSQSGIAQFLCAGIGSALLLTLPHPVAAADAPGAGDLEEIVVTAQKTGAASIQKTPIAMSAFSSADLKNTLTTDIKDLALETPNLSISQVGSSAAIYIRGVGTNNIFVGSDPDVTTQVDGVYIARPNAQFNDFLDVDRVEVLRGPQGTLYGRNAVGGTINVISKQPSDTFVGQQELTVGNFAMVQEQAYVSGPLIPGTLQASLAINYLRHDAYQENIAPGGNDINNANHGGFRGQLRWEPADNIDATTRFDWTAGRENVENDDNLLAPVPNAPLANSVIGSNSKVAVGLPQHGTTNDWGISEDIDWHFNSNLMLKSISAYRNNHFDELIGTDATELKFSSIIESELEKEITQEFNLQANYTNFEGVAGLYYFHDTDQALAYLVETPSPLVPSSPPGTFIAQATPAISSDAEAAFAQGTYHVTPTVDVTLGYRYTLERKHMDQDFAKSIIFPAGPFDIPGFPFIAHLSRDFHGSTPKFGIDWNVTNDAMLYFSVTRGYKSGGLNYGADSLAAASFEPETITSYEVGAKTQWFDHRLRLNVTGFKYDYKNLQVESLISPAVVAIGNAATATAKGLEVEISARPTPNWQLTGNLTLLDATYSSFPNAAVAAGLVPYVESLPQYNATAGTFNASGNRLSAAPSVTAFLAAQRSWDVNGGDSIYARAEYYWQDRVYYDPTEVDVQSQGPYGLANAFVGYDTGNGLWRVQLWGKNLADKSYVISAVANGLGPSGLVGAPRTFGVRLTRNF